MTAEILTFQEYNPLIALESGTTPVHLAAKQAGSPDSKSMASTVVLIHEYLLLHGHSLFYKVNGIFSYSSSK